MTEQKQQSALKRIYELLRKLPPGQRRNLAILTEQEFLFSYKDKLSHMSFIAGHGPAKGLRPERGPMMEFFTQLELLVNQIFVAHLLPSGGEVGKLEELLDCADLFLKVKLLKDWGIIEGRMKEAIMCLKEVRNGFAHRWLIEDVAYKGKSLMEQFEKFRSDAESVFRQLIELYSGGVVDVERLERELNDQLAHGH